MISYLKGDLLSSPAQVLVNTVNTVGVMGKGIALQFKNKYPAMFSDYQNVCQKNLLDVGKLYLWKSQKKWILMFPTKKHWRNPSKLEYIESGLKKLADNYERLGIESIAFPKLGCGNGGLNWSDVKPLMEKYLKPLPISVYIYVDNNGAEQKTEHTDPLFINWLHSNPKDLSFNALKEELLEAMKDDHQLLFADGSIKYVRWTDNRLTVANGKEYVISEDELCDFWDYVRNSGIIENDRIPEAYTRYSDVILTLLCRLQYLRPILVSNDENRLSESTGYQCAED